MDIPFTIKNQTLTKTDLNQVIRADSKNYLVAVFSFSEDWAGLTKTALFSRNGVTFETELLGDKCFFPNDFNRAGVLTLTVVGAAKDTTIVTNGIVLQVHKSGYVEGEPSPEAYLAEITKQAERAEAARDETKEIANQIIDILEQLKAGGTNGLTGS